MVYGITPNGLGNAQKMREEIETEGIGLPVPLCSQPFNVCRLARPLQHPSRSITCQVLCQSAGAVHTSLSLPTYFLISGLVPEITDTLFRQYHGR